MKDDVIEEAKSESPFCSCSFFLQKPSGNGLHLVTDYHGINGLIERPEWPFMTTSTILSLVNGNLPWVCSVDMLSGYHQVPLAEESGDLTSFLTPYGRYRFKRQSMVMKQAGDIFCQATDSIINATRDKLEEQLGDRFGIYKSIDDVLMQSASSEELEILISVFFKQCEIHNVKILQKKFQLDTSIVFGGVELDSNGSEIIYKPQNSKLQEICDFKTLSTKKELQNFLGVVATFHRWNPNI